jgi:SanA protein
MKQKLIWFAVIGFPALTAVVLACNLWILQSARGKIFDRVEEVPERPVGLVLGTGRLLGDGRLNWHFKNRMEAAAELYRAGKVKHLIVSGDNHRQGYDEPSDMRDALVAAGVPVGAITLDYAGFRTLDSVVRAKQVFGQERLTVVSGEFHNYRAIFICRYHGMDAVAFNARPVSARSSARTYVREWFARVLAVADLYVLRTKPKFLGSPVSLPVS